MNHFSADIPEAVWWTTQQPLMEPTPKTPSSKHQGLISQPNTLWGSSQFYNHHLATTTTTSTSTSTATATTSLFCGQNTAFSFNLNQEDDDEVVDEQITNERENVIEGGQFQEQLQVEKEPMFEKPLTPSDVGKLNRLVIPKQHAEKYFPLGGGDSVEKGLLLSFEDESSKCWRFRYSYWNSSQSYVLTKGWSRFVKEKRLDAGDVVLFERHRLDCDRLFIGWRRRSTASTGQETGVAQLAAVAANSGCGGRGGSIGWTRLFYSAHPYPSHPHGPPIPYQPDCLHAGAVVQNQTTPSGNSKRLRLFGVNLECQADESEPSTPDGSSGSSQGQGHYQYYTNTHASTSQSHMDINVSRDVKQTKYHQG